MIAAKIVEDFWTAMWNARNPDAFADFVVDQFVLTSAGTEIKTNEQFIACTRDFLEKIDDFEFEVIETFQNESGSRVAFLWRITGKNNGMFGTPPNQKPIVLTGTAIGDVRSDGKLLRNRAEQASWEHFNN